MALPKAGSNIQKRERARCAAIVRDRRQEIERALFTSSMSAQIFEKQKKYLRRFIEILTEIEHQILEITPDQATIFPQRVEYLGDFSVQEMELAQAIIEEQEQNPFEIIEGE